MARGRPRKDAKNKALMEKKEKRNKNETEKKVNYYLITSQLNEMLIQADQCKIEKPGYLVLYKNSLQVAVFRMWDSFRIINLEEIGESLCTIKEKFPEEFGEKVDELIQKISK